MQAVTATGAWRQAHPNGIIGLLEVSGIENSGPVPALEERKRAVETRLRERYAGFSRPAFLALPVMAAYDRYCKRFDKTYHVQLQAPLVIDSSGAGDQVTQMNGAVKALRAGDMITGKFTLKNRPPRLVVH